MTKTTKAAPAIGARIQGLYCMGKSGGTVLDHRGEVTGHTRNDAGEVRGITVAYPDGEMAYSLTTWGEYWRVLSDDGEPEARR